MKRYLLYIDILGFANLVNDGDKRVQILFERIDNLNVYRHDAFQTIVFSDTILIFNKETSTSSHDHSYIVMYACEFVQDLVLRCVDLEIQFRAILTYGEFNYQKMKNIESYHGQALIDAYHKEKKINAMGFFIDKTLLPFNRVFKTTSFDSDLDFVYLLQNIERLHFLGASSMPLDISFVEHSLDFPYLKEEVKVLEILKRNIDIQTVPKVKDKYIKTYSLYKKRYADLMSIFENAGFDHKIVSPDADWSVYNE